MSAVTIAGTLSVAGCDCSDSAPTTLLDSAFPGSAVDEAYLADDGAAFSNNDVDVPNYTVRVYRNVSNNDAILTFTGRNDSGNGRYGLFASYYNGSTFTTPVGLRGDLEDPSDMPANVNVLFLETSAFKGATSAATSAARGRDGDAILVWTNNDVDDVASSSAIDADANTRAYATYFDRSLATKSATGTITHGFETLAHPIDFDHVVTGGFNDPNVSFVGFASDSLHGTHSFSPFSGGRTLSGDATSFVHLVFGKSPSTGASAIGDRLFAVPFDLGQDGNGFVPQSAANAGMLTPAVGAFEDGDDADSNVVVHDGHVLWTADGVDADGEDTVLSDTIFAEGVVASVNVGSDPTADADATYLPDAEDVYGPDHGLASLYVVAYEEGFTSYATGARASDTDVIVSQIEGASRTALEIDAFTATIDVTDTDADFYDLRDGTDGDVATFESHINVDGTAIFVAMRQPTDDRGDADDSAGGALVGAPITNDTIYLQVVQTGRPASALASSTLAAPVKVAALESTGDVLLAMVPPPQGNVGNFEFQVGLPNGAALTDGGPTETVDFWQSNPNRVFFTYTQSNDQSGTDNVPSQVRLFTDGLELTPGAGTAQPAAALVRGGIGGALVTFAGATAGVGSDNGYAGFNAQVIDRGTDAGEFLTFFRANDNHIGDDDATMGAYTAPRLYVWDGLASTLVSSAASANVQIVNGNFQVVKVGSRVHAFFEERSSTPNSELVLGTRSFANSAELAAIPALGVAPTFIDPPADGGLEDFAVIPGTSTVGVYIEEGSHVYYNETRSDAAHYRVSGGLANPTLVDNDSGADIWGWRVFANDDLNMLSRSFFVYTKAVGDDDDSRLFIRVHD